MGFDIDWSQYVDGSKVTPNPGIHNPDGPKPSVPKTGGQLTAAGNAIVDGNLRQVALAAGKVVGALQSGFEALSEVFFGIDEVLTEHTEAIATLSDIASSPTTNAWVGDRWDMVTAPRQSVVCIGISGNKSQNVIGTISTTSGSGSGISGRQLKLNCTPVFTPGYTNGLGAPTRGDIVYAPIVVDREAWVDKLRWICGTDNSILGTNYYEMALCGYNPNNGNIEKLWGSGDIKDAEANTSTLGEVAKPMGLHQKCVPGQILFVAHQQTAPGIGQSARSFAAVPAGGTARPLDLAPLDAYCLVADNYTQGIPSSISAASLARESRFIPWMAISTTVQEPT